MTVYLTLPLAGRRIPSGHLRLTRRRAFRHPTTFQSGIDEPSPPTHNVDPAYLVAQAEVHLSQQPVNHSLMLINDAVQIPPHHR